LSRENDFDSLNMNRAVGERYNRRLYRMDHLVDRLLHSFRGRGLHDRSDLGDQRLLHRTGRKRDVFRCPRRRRREGHILRFNLGYDRGFRATGD
jgi:hypothetical protein